MALSMAMACATDILDDEIIPVVEDPIDAGGDTALVEDVDDPEPDVEDTAPDDAPVDLGMVDVSTEDDVDDDNDVGPEIDAGDAGPSDAGDVGIADVGDVSDTSDEADVMDVADVADVSDAADADVVDADVPDADTGEELVSLADDFDGDGPLLGYTTNNADALPDVARIGGRYRALLTDNTGNVTLHFNEDQGRLDAKLVRFPFEVIARNIGIGRVDDSQRPPQPNRDPFSFAGVQIHVPELDSRNSSHVVVGHRGSTHFTVEGKHTVNGNSRVNDAGAGIVPDGRADIRIVGNADRSLTVYWQRPNLIDNDAVDNWTLYRGTGELPGPSPMYGEEVYVGLITYAFAQTGVPFIGTCDALEGGER